VKIGALVIILPVTGSASFIQFKVGTPLCSANFFAIKFVDSLSS
jgi:hypothetical protein